MVFRRDRIPFAALASGGLLALAFPRPDLAELAWVGLVPVLLAGGRQPFRQGFLAGCVFFAGVLYWLNIVMTTFGGLHPVFALVAYLLLVGYLALFFAVPIWAAFRLRDRLGYPLPLTLPVLWVGLEFLRSFLFSGFPWATLGYSQQSRLLLIQSADLVGVYGQSFLLVLTNTVLAALFQAWSQRDKQLLPRWSLPALLVLLAANLGYGAWRLDPATDMRPERLNTILVQGNIDQSIKWNPAFQQQTVDIYRDLSREGAGASEGGLIIWPESATPFYFQDPSPLSGEVAGTARNARSWLLFGSPAYDRVNRVTHYLNSAFLLGPDGEIRGRSDKVHLVPFGEYVPLGRWLPFIDKLVVGIGDFSPGTISPLPLNGHRVGVLVCFEGIFPELARDSVRLGSELLVNITNDAWFGRSSAPYQHLGMTRFRAVENRVWVARAANTGVSALIAPSGRIVAATGIFETAVLKGTVGIGARPSLYTRWGDIIPTLFLGLSLFWLVRLLRRARLPLAPPFRPT
jgi:apolipoprotein N-acyltransferase